jgi:hypothetical protein
MHSLQTLAGIDERIFWIRGHKVMLDSDLASLYGVPTKSLNLSVLRNSERFPADFMFRLTARETGLLRFQFETSNKGRGGRRYLPYVFTEHGVAMLSSVLGSRRAIQVNIGIMRTFARIRHIVSTNKTLARKLEELERRVRSHDTHIRSIFQAIRELMERPEDPQLKIGFRPKG